MVDVGRRNHLWDELWIRTQVNLVLKKIIYGSPDINAHRSPTFLAKVTTTYNDNFIDRSSREQAANSSNDNTRFRSCTGEWSLALESII